MLPPLILRFFRVLEKSEIAEYRMPKRLLSSAMLASGSLVFSLIWGLTLSRADLEFAKIYPRVAQEFHRLAGKSRSYSSGEWGFRYYLGRAGAQPLPADSSLVRGGSFIAVPTLAQPNEIPPDLRSLLLPVQTWTYRPDTPVRVLDRQVPAGFWSTGWGLVPFSFSRQVLEKVDIFQVNFMVEQLPWAQTESESEIKPWPGYLTLDGISSLAILAKPGTRLRYEWPVDESTQLTLQCGLSPDSYEIGSDRVYEFVTGYQAENRNVLGEQRISLRPGIHPEDRHWRSVQLTLPAASRGFLYFEYRAAGSAPKGTGAFARPLLQRVH